MPSFYLTNTAFSTVFLTGSWFGHAKTILGVSRARAESTRFEPLINCGESDYHLSTCGVSLSLQFGKRNESVGMREVQKGGGVSRQGPRLSPNLGTLSSQWMRRCPNSARLSLTSSLRSDSFTQWMSTCLGVSTVKPGYKLPQAHSGHITRGV